MQSGAVTDTDSVHSREKRTPQIYPPFKKVSKHKAKIIKSKHIVSNFQKRSKKHIKATKRSKKSFSRPKVIKLPARLHIRKHRRAESQASRGKKTHPVHKNVKKKTNVRSSKQAKKKSKTATHLKNSKAKAQSQYKKSAIPGTAKEKQQKRQREKSAVAKINPKIIKVFRKFPRKTLANYLQKKGVSEKYIKAIIKQVKKPNGTIHKNKSNANTDGKRQEISKTFKSNVTTKQNVDGRKRKISVKKSHIPINHDSPDHKVKSPAKDSNKQRKAFKKSLSKHAKHLQKVKHYTSQHAKKRNQIPNAPLNKSNKRRNSSTHARILTTAPKEKLAKLKHKIRKANNLKLRVAKALLSHCETQNRLKKVFEHVNKSLRKAAVLARAIGEKFGIKKEDINDMTSEHTRDAVEEFLGKLF